jgi:transcriptional regulator with XRE-family HTH domain
MKKSIHTKEYAVFVERLKAARLEAGLTQVQVAKKLKRPQSHVSNVESGQQRVDIVELKRFAKMYGKGVEYFFK